MDNENKARMGGAPLSSPSNPYSQGELFDNLPSLQAEVDAAYADARNFLDGYGASAPVTDDAAAGRPINPPSFPD